MACTIGLRLGGRWWFESQVWISRSILLLAGRCA